MDDLERRLADGEIADRFPTDRELVEHYDVSRHTVREAVDRLKARGVIQRERGRGSTVVRPQLLQAMGTVYSLFRAVEATGAAQTSEVLRLDATTDERAAAKLEVDADAPLVVLERLRRLDGEPLALDTVWLPGDVAEPLLQVDFRHTALYDELDDLLGISPTSGEEIITPVVPDAHLREVLDLDEDEAVQRIVRTSRHGDRPLECRITLIRGSRFALVSQWPADRPPTVEVSPAI
nr:GntR family transcriptional regulator [Salsipaludibacter albus]